MFSFAFGGFRRSRRRRGGWWLRRRRRRWERRRQRVVPELRQHGRVSLPPPTFLSFPPPPPTSLSSPGVAVVAIPRPSRLVRQLLSPVQNCSCTLASQARARAGELRGDSGRTMWSASASFRLLVRGVYGLVLLLAS
jgi:hypothetical protein